jgi:DNA repair protein RecN (Recombination protein N)
MLLTIHVKNFALIDEAELSLGDGVQIVTGETGAGKSILIDAVTAALGGKVPKDIVRKGADSAFVELVFEVTQESKRQALEEMEIPMEEGLLIVSRRIQDGRSICKLNGITVTLATIRQATSMLIDIHGQHEHQSLLYKSKHLEILDDFIKNQTGKLRRELARSYDQYVALKQEAEQFTLDEEGRRREMNFCRYEIEEIDGAKIKPGEEEELLIQYRRMSNSRKIVDAVNQVYQILDRDRQDSAGDRIGTAARELSQVLRYDESLTDMQEQLYQIDNLIGDLGRQLGDYMDTMHFDPEELQQIESRLDQIRGLQAKYGSTYEAIMAYREEKQKRLEELEQYEERKKQVTDEWKEVKEELEDLCAEYSQIRRTEALKLVEAIRMALIDLNFLDVQVAMEFRRLPEYHRNGYDEAEFLISLNPGESMKSISQVASGGELSRIMLAIKSVLADMDDISTLIFDEIDTGISGRTAQKVAEKLSTIGRNHQVLCITHLAQIAAMADRHFLIEKGVSEGRTTTKVSLLDEEASIGELARLTGGAEMTETGLRHAREMKELANRMKQ